MRSMKEFHTTMMNNALMSEDYYLANLHQDALNRLETEPVKCNVVTENFGDSAASKRKDKCEMNVTIFTGAGVSAESNVPTFRDFAGLYSQYPIEVVTTKDGWKGSKDTFIEFWDLVKSKVEGDEECFHPNDAHHAISSLQRMYADGSLHGEFNLITTNVDTLHEQAGSTNVIKIHGSLGDEFREVDMDGMPYLMPDVVLFGEATRHVDAMWDAINKADLFVVVGSSLSLGGDSAMLYHAKDGGATTVEVNTSPTGHPSFDRVIQQPAATALPSLVESIRKIAA
jgi:NAD-dependent deacetylase